LKRGGIPFFSDSWLVKTLLIRSISKKPYFRAVCFRDLLPPRSIDKYAIH